ncbi:MAG: response regulator [Cyanothece sp. SIO2G6]|nr:response regulator [Cyanothece sp. SIO2G6]
MIVVNVSIDQLVECFELVQKEQFTGCLLAYSQAGQQWTVYFFMGRLVWGTGGSHRFRRWFRLNANYFPNLDYQELLEPGGKKNHLWEYAVLSKLLRASKVDDTTVSRFIGDALAETLFEILQEAVDFKRSDQGASHIKKMGGTMMVRSPLQALKRAKSGWEKWLDSGLVSYSPNLAPILKYPEILSQKIPDASYSKLAKLLTGSRSLREIAVSLKVDPLIITQSLFPFIDEGIIALQSIPDWIPPGSSQGMASSKDSKEFEISQENPDQPLIVCIDDSLSICRALEKVIKSGGYRFIGLQDSLQALPILIEKKPDLVFLDLVMPVASGYEICAQIRRIEAFKSIPVIILTGKDGMVDRVRAKLVGASDFLTKPVQSQKVLDITSRYLALRTGQNQVNARLEQRASAKDAEVTSNYGTLQP